MRGAVAAGHRLTAEAGAQVLAEGGNAVDACIAAAFVSWVAESTLTGPGAGGFILVHRGSDSSTRVLDHFVAVPRPPRAPRLLLLVGARRRPRRRGGGREGNGVGGRRFHDRVDAVLRRRRRV